MQAILLALVKTLFGGVTSWFKKEKADKVERELEAVKESHKTEQEADKVEDTIKQKQDAVVDTGRTDDDVLGADSW